MAKGREAGSAFRARLEARKLAGAAGLARENKAGYAAARKAVGAEPGGFRYLAVDGQGEPGGEAFQAAAEALRAVGRNLKMLRRFGGLGDFKTGALEEIRRGPRAWTLAMRVPASVTKAEVLKAAAGAGPVPVVRRAARRG